MCGISELFLSDSYSSRAVDTPDKLTIGFVYFKMLFSFSCLHMYFFNNNLFHQNTKV